jgi:UDP-N-acetyl-D-mannosaminuronic acid dehydrogenase
MKRISVVGLGYIGLPTAIQAASIGYDVYGYDINQEKVNRINKGDPAIFEPELSDRLWRVLKTGNFKVFNELQYADCFIITVPTPFKDDKSADLRHVFHAAESIAKRLMPGNLVILESTVPVGTTEKLAIFLEENSGLKLSVDFFVAYCPERVLPGHIFKELVENDRVIGGMCQHACERAFSFYTKFVRGVIHVTDDKTAEMVKLVENSSRDVQIAFANQIATMCCRAGIDPYSVIELANKHPRVKILTPTCGVGGHCVAVDPWFLIESFPEDTQLLRAARTINDSKPQHILARTLSKAEGLRMFGITKPKILALGLTFKPDVDDLRESPALYIAQGLAAKKDLIEFRAYDHNVSKQEASHRGIELINDVWDGIAWADIILILVKHKEFTLMREDTFDNKVLIDTCGLMHSIHQKQAQAFLEGSAKANTNLWG